MSGQGPDTTDPLFRRVSIAEALKLAGRSRTSLETPGTMLFRTASVMGGPETVVSFELAVPRDLREVTSIIGPSLGYEMSMDVMDGMIMVDMSGLLATVTLDEDIDIDRSGDVIVKIRRRSPAVSISKSRRTAIFMKAEKVAGSSTELELRPDLSSYTHEAFMRTTVYVPDQWGELQTVGTDTVNTHRTPEGAAILLMRDVSKARIALELHIRLLVEKAVREMLDTLEVAGIMHR